MDKTIFSVSHLPVSGKHHKAWKGERVGLYIRVPANVAEELRNEARQKQQHFNDIAAKRLQTNGK